MKDERVEYLSEKCTTEEERDAYYRVCIAEFQQLGYQEQYLAQLTDELVPMLGVKSVGKST
ncbi:hypothetical protein I6F40_16310 [Pseudoalteromonas sp. SWXJ133]|jgi:hypothetical protein|uniref:hypothetical protein n=1 Tax=unclassified Pseudoalteromonas TaxID=194690 RepID=UPI001407FCA2|nr:MULTISPECIES: hypothetical protein [unclassified Pseudoalteromonas]MBH0021887.1 hypothetical protein [Pseudoalteromonas sp. SWXJ133]